jgi:hypothetical protein
MGTHDPLLLHDRARESASESRKLTTALSAGGVAALFVSLTTETKPALTSLQQTFAAVSVLCFGLAVLSGMLAWQADAERWYFGAKEAEARAARRDLDALSAKRILWSRRAWYRTLLLRYLFLSGVVGAVFFTLARLFHR